jgi:outer membrane protein W
MKSMFKISCLFVLLMAITTTAFTQEKGQTKLGGGIMFGLPMGDLGDISNSGIGFGAECKSFISDKFAIGVQVGMISFATKDEFVEEIVGGTGVDVSASTQFIPLLATFDLFLADEGFKPYLGAGAGLYIYKATSSVEGMDVSASSSDVGVAPHVGFLFGLSDKIDLNVCANYNMVFTEGGSSTFITVNGGILFNL